MNGEIEQISKIVICARKALYENSGISFIPRDFIRSIRFRFLPKFFSKIADSVENWFEICKNRGLIDIKLIVPLSTKEPHLLGFSNMSQASILCIWKNGKSSCFTPVWTFRNKLMVWDVVYTEKKMPQLFKPQVDFCENKEEFAAVLSEIEAFSNDIGFPAFADIFQKARNTLLFSHCTEQIKDPPPLPQELLNIYYAVEIADVFGAMGSWNDSPAYYAEKTGRLREYNKLSEKLLYQIRYHLIYATNQCWK
ncbi:MAG: RNA polymerase subunit sigma [Ruminococcaceae bacterium]|nr:RNA polymerase subunit sigma [Oscillospiraceae bacterium]